MRRCTKIIAIGFLTNSQHRHILLKLRPMLLLPEVSEPIIVGIHLMG